MIIEFIKYYKKILFNIFRKYYFNLKKSHIKKLCYYNVEY